MSRLGKKPIIIPSDVEVKISGDVIFVKGPKGELSRNFKNDVEIHLNGNEISLKPKRNSKEVTALWGTYASHLKNMIGGVTNGFGKKLVVEGIGFKAQMEGTNLVLNLGFSHPIKIEIPKDLKVLVEKNVISVSGSDKEKVGAMSAKIRAFKKPEPYKGKGIRYDNEVIRRKSGKKAATAAA
jgi:large subunit ribosomal protein L6